MANKNTKRAREKGYSSFKDQENDANKVYTGDVCDTRWNNKNSKKNGPKNYKRVQERQSDSEE